MPYGLVPSGRQNIARQRPHLNEMTTNEEVRHELGTTHMLIVEHSGTCRTFWRTRPSDTASAWRSTRAVRECAGRELASGSNSRLVTSRYSNSCVDTVICVRLTSMLLSAARRRRGSKNDWAIYSMKAI
jgi:hypothetical protein